MPVRTTLVLPADLKARAVAQARKQGISFGEFVRRAIQNQFRVPAKDSSKNKAADPFFDDTMT